jgi:S1-C subfamily serine protease
MLQKITFLMLFISPLSFPQEILTGRDIARKSFESTVLITINDNYSQPLSIGSGFFVSPQIVATNVHVIKSGKSGFCKIVNQPTKYTIEGIVAIDPKNDIVLLKVSNVISKFLHIANSTDNVFIGDAIYVIGNPHGLEGTFSEGIISGIRRIEKDSLYQITAPISPGSSGGPVLDSQGNVIGIAFASITNGQSLNFAIPVSYVNNLLNKLSAPVSLNDYKFKNDDSYIVKIGDPNITSVTIENFSRNYGETYGASGRIIKYLSGFSFSIKNNLDVKITDIKYLIILYDNNKIPLDYIENTCYDTILPKLAKRTITFFDAGLLDQELIRKLKYHEVRVLSFKVIE